VRAAGFRVGVVPTERTVHDSLVLVEVRSEEEEELCPYRGHSEGADTIPFGGGYGSPTSPAHDAAEMSPAAAPRVRGTGAAITVRRKEGVESDPSERVRHVDLHPCIDLRGSVLGRDTPRGCVEYMTTVVGAEFDG
jgi:hypothetical protein